MSGSLAFNLKIEEISKKIKIKTDTFGPSFLKVLLPKYYFVIRSQLSLYLVRFGIKLVK